MPIPSSIIPAKHRVWRRRHEIVAPRAPAVLIGEVLVVDYQATWWLSSYVVEVLDLSPLKINGRSPTQLQLVENFICVLYADPVEPGEQWTYDGSPVAVFANGGSLRPGSGVTEQG